MDKIGFGGGCHWCTEAVFQNLRGVSGVQQGFIRSAPPQDSFSEAVIVSFDADIISLPTLTEIHLRTHASGSNHSMRGKYRSAVYVYSAIQREEMTDILAALQADFDAPLVTQILDFVAFKPSDAQFQNYYENGPEKPFCKTYIDPKLAKIKQKFGKDIYQKRKGGL